jgi:hypothetical protein
MGSPATKPATAPPPQQRRVSLQKVTSGKFEVPDRILLYGVEGIGKSTWAVGDKELAQKGAPDPYVIGVEDGTAHLDCKRANRPDGGWRWQDVLDTIDLLRQEKHDFKSVVLDTLDETESLIWRHVCERDNYDNIEAYGYGKGFNVALTEWRLLKSALEQLQREKQMNVILIAHSQIRTFKNPEAEDFDRYELKLHGKAAGALKDWCECVFFAQYETLTARAKANAPVKGVSTGNRIMRTTRTAAWDAKNRYRLTETLPLKFAEYEAGKRRFNASPNELKALIDAKLAQLADADLETKVKGFCAEAGDDIGQLLSVDNRLTALIAERATESKE